MTTVAHRLQHLFKLAGTMHMLLDKTISCGVGGREDFWTVAKCIGCGLEIEDTATDKVLRTVANVSVVKDCWVTVAEKVLRTVAGILDVINCSNVGSIIEYVFVDQGLGSAY